MSGADERVRTLLLRADNMLKKGRSEPARHVLAEARDAASDPAAPAALRELVERRLEALDRLTSG